MWAKPTENNYLDRVHSVLAGALGRVQARVRKRNHGFTLGVDFEFAKRSDADAWRIALA